MEDKKFTFDEFSTELQDFKIRKVSKFDRMWKVGYGGSVDQKLLLHDGVIYFGCCDHHVYAISAKDAGLAWKFEARAPIGESSPVLYKGTIYIGSYDYNMYAIDSRSGKLKWKFKTRGEIGSSVCASNGIVYFGSRDRIVYALRADDGSLVWKFETNDEIMSTPAVHGGKVFIGSFDHNLYCLDAMTGKPEWKFATQQEIYNADSFLIHGGIIYFGSFDNYLRAVRIEDRMELWRFRTGIYGIAASPVLHKNRLYQQTRDGILYALTMDGKPLWKFVTREVIALPVIHQDKIYVGSADHNMYCLNIEDGRVFWKFQAQGGVWWCPVIWKDVVYFSSWDCHVYAADKDTGEEVWRFNTGSGPSSIPPLSEGFEVELKIPKREIRLEEERKHYELGLSEGDENASAYKSRITYQVSTQYVEKGKYQVDSDEEGF
ncbi:MAG: PQQ-binding-like beta-propeller repeat protein [Candidatus Aenigmarchaeota archaeon]|nr:PQQ-binding-like beta-propeller repeat protein [Candidatus Aenigmarchaeota archaeon]